jgi:hypothetical protein
MVSICANSKGDIAMKVTVHLDEAMVKAFSRFGQPPHGYTVEQEITKLFNLQSLAMTEIKGLFTEREVLLIADACNSFWYELVDPKNQLILEVHDSIELDDLDSKWDVDKISLLDKLASLSHFHAHAILTTIIQFWDNADKEENDLNVVLMKNFQEERQ